MKLTLQHLLKHLQNPLKSIYWLSGDETYLLEKAVNAIVNAAKTQDFLEKKKFHIDTGFNWSLLQQELNSLSLFSEKQILECHLNQLKIPDIGKKMLAEFAENPTEDKVILIRSAKLAPATQNTKWFMAIEKNAVFIPVWPLTKEQLPKWVQKHLTKNKLNTSQDGIQLLIENGEGNLLAIAQNIEKLKLLYADKNELSVNDIAMCISDSSHFDVFALSDAVLLGDSKRIIHIFDVLKQQGVEAILVLWALAREIRTLANISFEIAKGQAVPQALTKARVWEKRKPLVSMALKRYDVQQWRELLTSASALDIALKTGANKNSWQALLTLALAIAGKKLHAIN